MPSRTTTLPLFPLSLVLFPGMTLPLHIFEECYKRMIGLCLREGHDFGVVLAGALSDVPGRCLTYSVGTTAHITGATRFPDGCMNLIALGEQRFRILSLDWDLAYCVARVAWLPEPADDAAHLRDRAARRWDTFRRRIARLTDTELATADLAAEPTEAAYELAAALPVNTVEKQRLLEATDTAARLRETLRLIDRELGLLNYLSEEHTEAIQPDAESAIFRN
ncbi:MAG: LON peptidase substrate-binding domain-containing protein [Thermomicrobia bacterium]|nr:LON peptidase substrate-binding domain-containing protein [Thermomicrobia bacterium]MCA1724716.1 LON peptidase substrate-binding domain-containing protein [Thermomicrobia bacterium]